MRAVRGLASVIVSVVAVMSIATITATADESAVVNTEAGVETNPEARVAASLEHYLTTLARTPIDTTSADAPRAPVIAGLDVKLMPDSPVTAEDYPAWLARLRPDHETVEYRVAALRIAQVEGAPLDYDTRFALERRTVDHEGLAHIARWQQRWRIRLEPDSQPRVTSLEQAPRLAFPGTGPQIVCF